MRRLLLISLVLIFGLGAATAWFGLNFIHSKPSENSVPVVYEVHPGPFLKIAEDLEDMRVVSSAFRFLWYARLTGKTKAVRIGEYDLTTDMLPTDVLNVLVSGKSRARMITIPEGLNRFEIADLFEQKGMFKAKEFLDATEDKELLEKYLSGLKANSLEGYLFPETYSFTKYTSANTVVRKMVDTFFERWAEVETMVQAQGGPIQTLARHEIVTFASIVEKETGAVEERPLVASVFFNRMKKKMKLQTDPTVMYGAMVESGKPIFNITREMLLKPTAYNTYTMVGLPPGPISNPGKESLLASIRPAASEFIFFVSRNDGTHVFSKTLADHNAAVKTFQLTKGNREGKSWRDLSKKVSEQSAVGPEKTTATTNRGTGPTNVQ
ncbi:MAG: endolytic transglycosylase MltG [Bdellovibrionales bacterium]|nr:endolytic transglycosylase MltG [Bdellovibrionales bacterium]